MKRGGKMINKPIHLTDAEFEEKVLQSELPVIVDFWAPWCGPCHMIAPVLEKIASENAGKLIVAKVNIDEHNQKVEEYGIQGIPTMLFFKNGLLVHEQVGALTEPHLREMVDEFLSIDEKIIVH
jgi:thioredoxin 1